MDLFDLYAKLTLDTKEYNKGLDDAEDKASKSGSEIASKFGSKVATAGKVAAAGIAAAGTALVVGIGHGDVLAADGLIVGNGIVRAERSLALLYADRMDRHKPDDIHTQLLETRQLLFGSGERTGRGVLAYVHLINDRRTQRLLRSLGSKYR